MNMTKYSVGKSLAAVAAITAISGCQMYHSSPLPAAPDTPDMVTLSVQASTFHHDILPPVSIDLSDGLSPDEAAVIAVLANPSLRTVRDQRALADVQLLEAGLLPAPQLSAGMEPVTGGASDGTVTGHTLGLAWDITSLITARAKRETARQQKSEVNLEVAWQEWQTAEAAKLAVCDLRTLQIQEAFARETQTHYDQQLKRVQKAVQKGLLTTLDLAAVEAEAVQASTDRSSLENRTRQQRLLLNQTLGLPPQTSLPLEAPDEELPRLNLPAESDILKGLEERRLDLAALRSGYAAQEAAVRTAVLKQFPSIGIGLSHNRDTGNVISMPFDVTIDLPLFGAGRVAVTREKATRRQLRDEYNERRFQARAEISDLIGNAANIEQQIDIVENSLPAIRQRTAVLRNAADDGQMDLLSLYAAENELTARQQKLASLRKQQADTRIALEIAAGVYDLKSLLPPSGSKGENHE